MEDSMSLNQKHRWLRAVYRGEASREELEGRPLLRVAVREEGMLTLVSIFPILAFLVFIGLVGNVAEITARKMETQNAADAVGYSSAVWMARGMNAITATNHLVGELTALIALHEGIGGPELDYLAEADETFMTTESDGYSTTIKTLKETAIIPEIGYYTALQNPARRIDKELVENVVEIVLDDDNTHKGGAMLYDAKIQLKKDLAMILAGKTALSAYYYTVPPIVVFGVPVGWIGAVAVTVSHAVLDVQIGFIAQDWFWLDIIGNVARLKPLIKMKRGVEYFVIPELTAYADYVAGLQNPPRGQYQSLGSAFGNTGSSSGQPSARRQYGAGPINDSLEITMYQLCDRKHYNVQPAVFPTPQDLRLPVMPEPVPNVARNSRQSGSWGSMKVEPNQKLKRRIEGELKKMREHMDQADGGIEKQVGELNESLQKEYEGLRKQLKSEKAETELENRKKGKKAKENANESDESSVDQEVRDASDEELEKMILDESKSSALERDLDRLNREIQVATYGEKQGGIDWTELDPNGEISPESRREAETDMEKKKVGGIKQSLGVPEIDRDNESPQSFSTEKKEKARKSHDKSHLESQKKQLESAQRKFETQKAALLAGDPKPGDSRQTDLDNISKWFEKAIKKVAEDLKNAKDPFQEQLNNLKKDPGNPSIGNIKNLPGIDIEWTKQSQWVRAAYPNLDAIRAPILGVFDRKLPGLQTSSASKHFKRWTNRYLLMKAHQFQTGIVHQGTVRDDGVVLRYSKKNVPLSLYVMADSYPTGRTENANWPKSEIHQLPFRVPKGEESWAGTTKRAKREAEKRFTLLSFAKRPMQPVLFTDVIYTNPNSQGMLTCAQAIVYNANEQKPIKRPKSSQSAGAKQSQSLPVLGTVQPNVGWDTLNWKPPVQAREFPKSMEAGQKSSGGGWPWDVFRDGANPADANAETQLNWQAKLMPVTESRLQDCRDRSLPGNIRRLIEKTYLKHPEMIHH